VKLALAPVERSKKDEVIALLSRETGATLSELITTTGWQKHSILGFLSGTLKKKIGSEIRSERNAVGNRVCRIPGVSE
jgi:hypothetical protein